MEVNAVVLLVIVYQEGEYLLVFFLFDGKFYVFFQLNRSGKNHAPAEQYLKTIIAEIQERREDCDKLRERLERLEVSTVYISIKY